MKKEKVLLSWSGGKDSAVSLFELKSPEYKVEGLFTTVIETSNRTQMHDVRVELIEKQAEALELPLYKVFISEGAHNDEYETKLKEALDPLRKKGLQGLAFGDLHLEDIKKYRNSVCERLKLKSVYPIWNWKNDEVLRVFFGLGYKAVVSTIDLNKLPISFVGRTFDRDFVQDLPSKIDSCGENGEFHTFVFDGPFFQRKVLFQMGEKYEKNGFAFQDMKSVG